MIGFGLGLIIPQAIPRFQDVASAIFLASLAAAFVVIFLLSPSRKIPLAVAAVLGVVALDRHRRVPDPGAADPLVARP